jgi:hypothetical protein
MMEARIVVWLVKGGWRWVAGAAVVIAIGLLEIAVWNAGYETADEKCEATAKQAQIEKLQLELMIATAQIESEQETVRKMQAKDADAQARQQVLQTEVATLRDHRRKESKGKRDALVNPRCDLTHRGVQFFTRR